MTGQEVSGRCHPQQARLTSSSSMGGVAGPGARAELSLQVGEPRGGLQGLWNEVGGVGAAAAKDASFRCFPRKPVCCNPGWGPWLGAQESQHCRGKGVITWLQTTAPLHFHLAQEVAPYLAFTA